MKNTQIIALASWLSFLAMLWLIVLDLIELTPRSYTFTGIFFFVGLFSGLLAWDLKK